MSYIVILVSFQTISSYINTVFVIQQIESQELTIDLSYYDVKYGKFMLHDLLIISLVQIQYYKITKTTNERRKEDSSKLNSYV